MYAALRVGGEHVLSRLATTATTATSATITASGGPTVAKLIFRVYKQTELQSKIRTHTRESFLDSCGRDSEENLLIVVS